MERIVQILSRRKEEQPDPDRRSQRGQRAPSSKGWPCGWQRTKFPPPSAANGSIRSTYRRSWPGPNTEVSSKNGCSDFSKNCAGSRTRSSSSTKYTPSRAQVRPRGSLDTANILKPALARGELQVIGATTLDGYREDIESDPALERRFQKILVEPASEEETLQILHNIAPHYERHHGVRYSDEALRACVALTGRYITDRNFPDKAIDVLDETGARIHLQDKGKTEKPSRKTASREPVGAAAGAKTPKNRSRKTAAADTTTVGGAVWTLPSDPGPPEIRAEHIEAGYYLHDGNPSRTALGQRKRTSARPCGLSFGPRHRPMRSRRKDFAVDPTPQAGLRTKGVRSASSCSSGPTGVGKTLLAKELSNGSSTRTKGLIRIDMSEYSENTTSHG